MTLNLSRVIQTIDSHTEGNPTRVIVGGIPIPPGESIADKRIWFMNHNDEIRQLLNFEPRGNGMMCSVLLMPAIHDDADFAAIIMEQDEYVPMCGHCIIGTATTIVATGMVKIQEPVTNIHIETPAGLVVCRVNVEKARPTSVTFENVESFLLHRDIEICTSSYGQLNLDIAYGGDFYAIVDADKINLPLDITNEANIIKAASEIRECIEKQVTIQHPERTDINRCYMVQFVSSHILKSGDAHTTVVAPPGAIDRSPCGTGTSAMVATLFSKGELGLEEPFRYEGPLGTYFIGRAIRHRLSGANTFITPEITGRAFITGFHQFVLEEGDPFPRGYRIGPQGRLTA